YLRERAADMRDVTSRLLSKLMGVDEETDLSKLKEPCIIISYDLSPSRTALLDRKMVLGFATDVGSKTSHTAIMARSLRIPAVVGLRHASGELVNGSYALLDGYNGLIFDLSKLKEPCIIISYDLSPSRTALLDRKMVLGFATDVGSKTSHTAIMARSLRIPAVVGLRHASGELVNGSYALLDGYNGLII